MKEKDRLNIAYLSFLLEGVALFLFVASNYGKVFESLVSLIFAPLFLLCYLLFFVGVGFSFYSIICQPLTLRNILRHWRLIFMSLLFLLFIIRSNLWPLLSSEPRLDNLASLIFSVMLILFSLPWFLVERKVHIKHEQEQMDLK